MRLEPITELAVYRQAGPAQRPRSLGIGVADAPSLPIGGVDQLGEDEHVRRNLGLLIGSFSVDFRLVPVAEGALYLGLRGGYLWQIDQGAWVADDSEVDLRGGPNVDTSGPYLRLAFGIVAEL